jgi:hypothetical protein
VLEAVAPELGALNTKIGDLQINVDNLDNRMVILENTIQLRGNEKIEKKTHEFMDTEEDEDKVDMLKIGKHYISKGAAEKIVKRDKANENVIGYLIDATSNAQMDAETQKALLRLNKGKLKGKKRTAEELKEVK